MDMVWNILFMFGGVAVMMIGMKLMGASLEKVASGGMKKLLSKVTSNRLAGVGVGIGVTCIIQSSTATTVMLVGFVNIGLLTLMQATNVIMGANIGTTVTAHIVSLSGVFDIGAFAAGVGFIGVMLSMLSKKQNVQNIGEILTGLGLVFIGLEFISSCAKDLMFIAGDKTNPQPWAQMIFAGDHFPLLLIVIGIVITALVHSSSTITSLMVVLASIGILPFKNAMFLALGSNIGTCITSIMSSIGTSTNAKRTAMVHLTFNTVGCLIFIVPLWIFGNNIASFFAALSSDAGQQLAIFHTLFNIATTIVLLPLTNELVKFVSRIVPEKEIKEEKFKLSYVDDLMLATPAVAVSRVKLEIVDMSQLAKENLNLTLDMLFNSDMENEEKVKANEEKLNYLNKAITSYITKLMSKDLSITDDGKIASYYHVVSDLERVGDYAENIMEYAVKLMQEDVKLSSEAVKELKNMRDKINELFDISIKAFNERNLSLLDEIYNIEEEIDDITDSLGDMHIERLKNGLCNAHSGSTYLQTISNLERVADHIYNVAVSIKKYEKYCEKFSQAKYSDKNA